MSADAGGVRLVREPGDESRCAFVYRAACEDGMDRYIAYPAAQAKAMERVVEAAKPAADWLESGCYCPCCEQRNECVEDCTYADDAPAEWARMVAVREVSLSLIKALATLPRAHGGEGGGA